MMKRGEAKHLIITPNTPSLSLLFAVKIRNVIQSRYVPFLCLKPQPPFWVSPFLLSPSR